MSIAEFHKTVGTRTYAQTSQGQMWVVGQNKGLMKEYKALKRQEAGARDAKTEYKRTKAYRRAILSTLDSLHEAQVGPFDYESVLNQVTPERLDELKLRFDKIAQKRNK